MYSLELLGKEAFEEVWAIMEESFPVDERRNREGQRALLGEEAYHLYGYKKQGKIAAFFAVWRFREFAYIEHFAVERSSRNGGIGAGLLRQLTEDLLLPVVLEVEPPEGEMENRRIGFYQRNGYQLNGYSYIQPALSAEGRAVPLLIMSYPKPLTEPEFIKIKNTLYREVYKAKSSTGQ